MHFTKWQGCGNDFILVDCREKAFQDESRLARELCDRHYGIGADGVLLVLSSEVADIRMRIINADGSEPEMCGNGIRCFARYVWENGLVSSEEFSVETGAGVLRPCMIFEHGTVKAVRVDMGEPRLAGEQIPVKGFGVEHVVGEEIEVLGERFKMTCVSMGNPHCVIFVDDISMVDLSRFGSAIETHAIFPRKTNVEFAQILDRSHIRMRVWERGAAITLACGTGTCAVVVAAVLNHFAERSAKVELDGGILEVDWNEDGHVYMTGAAELVFSGVVSLEAVS